MIRSSQRPNARGQHARGKPAPNEINAKAVMQRRGPPTDTPGANHADLPMDAAHSAFPTATRFHSKAKSRGLGVAPWEIFCVVCGVAPQGLKPIAQRPGGTRSTSPDAALGHPITIPVGREIHIADVYASTRPKFVPSSIQNRTTTIRRSRRNAIALQIAAAEDKRQNARWTAVQLSQIRRGGQRLVSPRPRAVAAMPVVPRRSDSH